MKNNFTGGTLKTAQVDNRSFSEVVRTPPASPRAQPNNQKSAFVRKDDAPSWLDCCALGVLKSPMPIKCLSDLFPVSDSPVTSIIPLGGVSFLFKFCSHENRNSMVANQPDWFGQLFSVFRNWEEGDAACNRLCWVLVKGVPPCAWSKNFFQLAVSSVGEMIDWSPETKNRNRMDVAEILILTNNMAFLHKVVAVKFGECSFNVGITESQYDPLDWMWSSVNASTVLVNGTGNSTGNTSNNSSHQDSEDNQLSNFKSSNQSQPSPQVPKPVSSNNESCSADPFNLRPIINNLNILNEPSQPTHFTLSPSLTPEKASSMSANSSKNIPDQPCSSNNGHGPYILDLPMKPTPNTLVPYPSTPSTMGPSYQSHLHINQL
ncbi:hypothetical protein Tsubulata_030592 [Turnera subulata]|uniref:DUF4283 domain-containing protein n=1 Tax=Turnera subulata TaxID=218843 RepID=A0A9Q0FH12_9ROSI|nr:hypothetical protein Tsubulata_030592 [Turnera subulata]